jgi:hypothetical protein
MKLEKEDLVARLMGAQMFARFILRGYSAKVSYDVDFHEAARVAGHGGP